MTSVGEEEKGELPAPLVGMGTEDGLERPQMLTTESPRHPANPLAAVCPEEMKTCPPAPVRECSWQHSSQKPDGNNPHIHQ